jgi:hypothetical protein
MKMLSQKRFMSTKMKYRLLGLALGIWVGFWAAVLMILSEFTGPPDQTVVVPMQTTFVVCGLLLASLIGFYWGFDRYAKRLEATFEESASHRRWVLFCVIGGAVVFGLFAVGKLCLTISQFVYKSSHY